MKRMLTGAAVAAALGLCACEGMAPGGYGDMPEDPNIAAAQAAAARAAMPQQPMPPTPMSLPNGQPRPGAIPQPVIPPAPTMPATGGPSRMPAPPAAPAPAGPVTGGPSKITPPPVAPAPAPAPRGGCSAPNVSIRKEITGAVEINCGPPPAPVPSGMSCKAGEQLTYLTRNGSSSYQCMK
jgi:hypothetical protein